MSARTYYMDDCTIALPAGFRDRTVNALEWDTEDGEKIALVVQREPRPALDPQQVTTVDLAAFVATRTEDYPVQFAGFHLEREEATAAGAPFEIQRRAFRWKYEQHVLYHHQAWVLAGDVIVVLTGTGKALHSAAVDRLLDHALADFHVRGD